jgi:hypothetical protein
MPTMNAKLLAIAGPADQDGVLLEDVASHRPDHITIVLPSAEDGDRWAVSEDAEARAVRDRLAVLMTRAAETTGASVSAVVGDLDLFVGEDFDAVVRPGLLIPA